MPKLDRFQAVCLPSEAAPIPVTVPSLLLRECGKQAIYTFIPLKRFLIPLLLQYSDEESYMA
jgi:hypothetical protein